MLAENLMAHIVLHIVIISLWKISTFYPRNKCCFLLELLKCCSIGENWLLCSPGGCLKNVRFLKHNRECTCCKAFVKCNYGPANLHAVFTSRGSTTYLKALFLKVPLISVKWHAIFWAKTILWKLLFLPKSGNIIWNPAKLLSVKALSLLKTVTYPCALCNLLLDCCCKEWFLKLHKLH